MRGGTTAKLVDTETDAGGCGRTGGATTDAMGLRNDCGDWPGMFG